MGGECVTVNEGVLCITLAESKCEGGIEGALCIVWDESRVDERVT